MERACPKCGYVQQPWEKECPRCARWAEMRCRLCDRVGVVGECDRCHRALCEVCAIREQARVLCADCRGGMGGTAAEL